MTDLDLELLDRAAKAAGITLDFTVRGDFPPYYINERGGHSSWNPLTDDGDALRLAVKLGIDVRLFGSLGWKSAENHHWCGSLVDRMGKSFQEPALPDPYAATRRAIVRAAAAVLAWNSGGHS